MKLAEIIANVHNSNFTDEQFASLKEQKNVNQIFNILHLGWSYREKEYNVKAWQILDYVEKNVNGFQADIAKKAKCNRFEMTEKQTWCVVFAFINN